MQNKFNNIFGSLGKQISLVVLGDAITFISSFVSTMILARLITVSTMGTYRQIIYLITMAINIFEFGISNSIYRFWNLFYGRERESFAKILLIFTTVLGLLATIGLILLAPVLSSFYDNPSLKFTLAITSLIPLGSIPSMIIRPIYLSEGHSLFATGLETTFAILSLISIVIPIWLGKSFEYALMMWVSVSLLKFLTIPVLLRKYLFAKSKWIDKDIIIEVTKYLWPIQVGRLPGYVLSYFDKVVMSILLSTQNFAIYSLGAREIPFIGTIGYSVSNVLIPQLMQDYQKNNMENIFRRWKIACERSALAIYLPTTFCVVFAEPVVKFLFSSNYAESSIPFRIFALIAYIRVIEYASLAKVVGSSKLIMNSSLISVIVMLVLSFPLTKLFGIAGMAYVVLLSNIVPSFYLLFRYCQLFKVNLSKYYPIVELSKILLISIVSVYLSKLILSTWITTDGNSLLIGLSLALYFGFALVFYLFIVSVFYGDRFNIMKKMSVIHNE